MSVTRLPVGEGHWPYGEEPQGQPTAPADVPLVPYHDWAQRGPSTMRVWIPLAP
ncbi:MAG: hypothetical protein WBX17_07330 [Microbacterium sp.]